MQTVPSPILRAFVPPIFVVANIFALYLLFRGHNLPGGGFIAGLVSAISWILLVLSLPTKKIDRLLEWDTLRMAARGLLLVFFVGAVPLFWGEPFLTHNLNNAIYVLAGKFGITSPLLYDIGIYFLVLGVIGKIGFSLRRAIQGIDPITEQEEDRYGGKGL